MQLPLGVDGDQSDTNPMAQAMATASAAPTGGVASTPAQAPAQGGILAALLGGTALPGGSPDMGNPIGNTLVNSGGHLLLPLLGQLLGGRTQAQQAFAMQKSYAQSAGQAQAYGFDKLDQLVGQYGKQKGTAKFFQTPEGHEFFVYGGKMSDIQDHLNGNYPNANFTSAQPGSVIYDTTKGPNGGSMQVPSQPLFENANQKGMGEYWSKEYGTILTNGQTAGQQSQTYNLMQQDVLDPSFYSGKGANVSEALKNWGVSLGWLKPGENVSMEQFHALSNQSVREQFTTLGSGVSEGDRRLMEQALPNLGNTRQGNLVLIMMQQQIAARKLQMVDAAQQYVQQHGQLDNGFIPLQKKLIAEPIFGDRWLDNAKQTANQEIAQYDQQAAAKAQQGADQGQTGPVPAMPTLPQGNTQAPAPQATGTPMDNLAPNRGNVQSNTPGASANSWATTPGKDGWFHLPNSNVRIRLAPNQKDSR